MCVCVCGGILFWKGDLVIAIEMREREREREREIRCLHNVCVMDFFFLFFSTTSTAIIINQSNNNREEWKEGRKEQTNG